jgi:hypothetical protein
MLIFCGKPLQLLPIGLEARAKVVALCLRD